MAAWAGATPQRAAATSVGAAMRIPIAPRRVMPRGLSSASSTSVIGLPTPVHSPGLPYRDAEAYADFREGQDSRDKRRSAARARHAIGPPAVPLKPAPQSITDPAARGSQSGANAANQASESFVLREF